MLVATNHCQVISSKDFFRGLTGFTAPLQVTLFSGIKISLINTPGTKTIWYLFAKLKDNKVHKYLLHPPSIRKIK